MYAEKAKKILEWYGYPNAIFDCVDKDIAFYFRYRSNELPYNEYVLKVVEVEDNITIYRADEDFYEKYEVDFYNYHFDATFTNDELEEYLKEVV